MDALLTNVLSSLINGITMLQWNTEKYNRNLGLLLCAKIHAKITGNGLGRKLLVTGNVSYS